MNKEKILREKLGAIEVLRTEIAEINRLELYRLYRWRGVWRRGWGNEATYDMWGYAEVFNKESVRFCIVATDSPGFEHVHLSRSRGNITALLYSYLSKLSRVRREDIPLMVAMRYKFVELEEILKGRGRVKID